MDRARPDASRPDPVSGTWHHGKPGPKGKRGKRRRQPRPVLVRDNRTPIGDLERELTGKKKRKKRRKR